MKKRRIINNRIFACAMALFCTLLWGTAFPFIKLGYSSFAIEEADVGAKLLFAGLRFTTAGLMVYLTAAVISKKLPSVGKSEILPITLLGLVQTSAQYLFTYIGLGFTSGTNTSVITACASFFTVLAAPIFFKSDRLTFMKIAGCALGFAGVAAISGIGAIDTASLLGDALILMSTISAAAGNIISKKIASGRDPVKITAFQLIIGGLVLTASGYAIGGRLSFDNIESVLILLWLAFVSAASFTIWTALLKHHPASVITVFNLLVPVFGTILSGLVLGEDVFRPETVVSLALISAGIAAVNLSGNFNKRR